MKENTPRTGLDEYVLGRSEEEARRLHDQARMLEEPTCFLLEAVGLSSGQVCLDAGCGAGHVMRLMGERVGKTGRVVGLDADGGLGRRTSEQLNATGISRFEFVEGDVRQTGAFAPQSFDLTFTRLMLIHLDEPIAALQRMWEWTRPGGAIGAIDFDLQAAGAYPPSAAVTECLRIARSTFDKAGRDVRIGMKLPHTFEQAGIGAPDGVRATPLFFQPLREIGGYMKATYRSVLPIALKLGLTSEGEAAEFFASMDRAIREEPTYVLGPLVVAAWKKKPVTGWAGLNGDLDRGPSPFPGVDPPLPAGGGWRL
jgi:ubiquinone/menaquinone biosynthesis C-methylase UbiE